MARSLTQREQKKIYFTEDELRRIVSRIPGENNRAVYVSDENVRHVGTEIYNRLGVVAKTFEYNFDVEEMMTRYAAELPRNMVFRLVLRRMISHLLNVAFGTLMQENMLFRIFFDRFPKTEYTTPTITQHDLTVDRVYDKLNEHLQSNDQISVEGVWRGYMIVSRLVVDRRRRERRHVVRNDDEDVVLEGQGKQENYLNNLGLVRVDVEGNCLSHAILLGMSMKNKSDLYKAFLAGFDRYLSEAVEDQLIEIENSCVVKSRFDNVKKFSMKKLSVNYLSHRNFDLLVYGKRFDDVIKIYGNDVKTAETKLILYHHDNHFDLVENLGLFLYGRKVNFCQKCLIKVSDCNNHICFSNFNCFKCKSILAHVICPLCEVSFDSEFCLKSHYEKSIDVGMKNFEGKRKMTACEVFKYCKKCCSYVRRFYYVNAKGKKKCTIVEMHIAKCVKEKDH